MILENSNSHKKIAPLNISISFSKFAVPKTKTNEPFSIPKHFWHQISSPYTESWQDDLDEEIEETTTHEPYPFFDETSTQINVTTQLGSHVNLHCRVNDLREKTVSICFLKNQIYLSPSNSNSTKNHKLQGLKRGSFY